MKSLFLFVSIFFVTIVIQAQTFADPNFAAIPIGGGGWDFPTGATFSQDGQKLFVWQKGGKVFVCQRDGGGNYFKQDEPVIDLTAEVANWDAHGLVGFALDPNFQSNGFIYLMYVVNRHYLLYYGTGSYVPGTDGTGKATIGRITRYKTITSAGHLVADLSTRKILVGETKETGMPILHHSHGVGSLAFAADGTLLASMGDAASYEGIDAGSFSGTFYQQALIDGIIRPAENVGAFRSQMLTSLNGKLLRLDPATGDGLPSNPFYVPGQPRATKSRVYAFGMRNCFRIAVRPGTGSTDPSVGDIGEVYMGDVGFASWEELNIVKAPGMNFGWPIYEGNEYTIPSESGGATYNALSVQNLDEPNPLYGTGGCTQQYFQFRQLIKQANPDENKTLYNPCNNSIPVGTGYRYYHSRPALEWSHAHAWTRVGIFDGNNATVAMIGSPESQVVGTPAPGSCAVGGVWYTGGSYPSQYTNTYFQADFVGPLSGSSGPWLKRLSIDFTDKVTRVDDFATGFQDIVCVTRNPINGNLVTVQMLENGAGIKEIVYGGNQPPIAKPESNKTFGTSPLSVNFNGNNSYDPTPGGSIVSYSWNFGGGVPATSNAANPGNIVFTEASGNPRKFVVTLTVTDNGGATNTESIIISVNNTPPVVNITSPIKNSFYNAGPDTLYACTATVTDAQHNAGQLTYEWQTSLRHNTHEHREAIKNDVNSSTLIQRVGFYGDDVYYWLIELTVTDAAGLSTKDSAKIYPNRSGTDNTPPLVSVVSPVNGTNGVSTGTNVAASFNEAINASTVTGTTFQLKNAANNIIPASVNTSSNQITLTPSAALVGSVVYTATIKGGASGVKDLAGNALANDYSWTFTTAAVDNTPPTITSVSPVSGATGVNIGATVTADLNEAINASTVNGTTFQLRDANNNLVSSTLNTSTNQITLTPSTPLNSSTVYSATIKGGASGLKDLAGNALASDYSWSFTTAAAGAQSPVTIQSFTTKTGTAAIAHQLTGVPAGALLVLATTGDAVPSDCIISSSPSLTWTKRSDAGAAQSANAEIWTAVYTAGGSITVTSNWGSENSQASVCYVVLNAEPSLNGAFATAVSQAAPSVTITTTRDNSIIFGCTADWNAVNGATRTLRDAATERLYFKDGHYTTYYYTKAAATAGAYTEGVSIPTGQQASTALLEIRGATVTVDITPPTVTSVTPVNGATGVPVSTTATAIFNEAMDAATINSSTIELRNPLNTLITATVSYNVGTRTATVTPSVALTNSTVYTATVKSGTTGVKDAAGNALISDYNWSFTTAAADLTPPTVSSVSPFSGATSVSISTTVTANFNEAINASTVTTSTVQLRNSANTLITSAVSVSGNQITLTPSSALANSTFYTVTITGGASGVKDVAGNALATDYSWSFTTGGTTVQSAVTIQSVSTQTGTSAIAHVLTGVPAGALLVLATTGDAVPSDCIISSSPSLTWTKRSDAGAAQSANAEIWTAVYTAGGSITVTSNWGSENSQASVCYVVLNAEPSLNGAFGTGVLQSAPSVTITTTRDNSIIFGCTADWKAVNGATRTLRDAATERLYFKDGNYTTYYYTKAAASIADYTEGVSLPTGQQASTALLEIRGTAAPASIPPTITTHPTSQTRCAGASVSFTSAADGTPAPTVQWQESTNGTTWNDVTGATNGSLTLTTTPADNNKQYRAVWTNSGGSVNSDPATLTVNSIPVAPTITVADNCENSVLTAGSFSGSLLWSNGSTTAFITVLAPGTFTVTQTVNGCTSGVSQTATAAPKPIPQLSGSLSATATSGTLFGYTAASATAGTAFAWSRAIVTGISNAAAEGTGDINETLVNTTSSPVNVTYVYTLSANGCSASQNVLVTVNPVSSGNCTISNTSLSTNFNATAIPAGRYIWFNSSFDPGPLGAGTDPVTITITNGVITFTANNVPYTLNVPNASIRFDATVTSASTQFINNAWETVVPRSYTNDVFMSGLSYMVPVNFPGNYMNVKWTADISIDKPGISLGWRWAAATYTGFAGNAGINVKPINGGTQNPYANTDRASTPQNFKSFVVDGAKGTGGTNYTGSFTTVNSATCTGSAAPTEPTVTVVNNCGNSVLTAGSFNGSLLWSNGATTASITVTTAGTYSVTQTVNGSTSPAGNGTAAPKAIPQLSGNLSATATSGTAFSYTAASTTAGTTFGWSRAIVAGISNAAANGTGNINETLINTTSSPNNVTYVYTLTANGCSATQNVVVTVNPVSTVNCTISNTSLSTNFSATAIPAGRYIWFNSSFDPGPLGAGTDPVTITVTNGVITFTANNVPYTLNVPNARIRFDATATSASTQFINNAWETVVPRSYTSDIFMSGLSYLVPVNFPGNYMNVNWTSDISIDKAGISLGWRWAAATYTSFAGNAGINVKPINGSIQNPYANADRASTPENFKSFVVNGARGTGGTNYTGSFTTVNTATCTVNSQRSSQPGVITQRLPGNNISEEKLVINVMPNPSSKYFNLVLKSNNSNQVQVKITNIFGQVLEKYKNVASNTTLRVGQELSGGTYFVEITQGDEKKIMKIIKTN